MQNQNSEKKLVLPQVRYHPSIQNQSTTTRTTTGTTTRTTTGTTARTRTNSGKSTGTRNTSRAQPNQNIRPDRRTDDDPEETGSAPSPDPVQDLGPKGVEALPSPGLVLFRSSLDPRDVEQVEVLTRGQRTNPAWFSWRKNRITASIAHQITHSRFANGTSKTPPLSYLSAITGEAKPVQTRAMDWGVRMEAEAVDSYQKLKSASLRRRVSILSCGLFVDAHRPWLAASPDGIVTDSVSGQWLSCLEVKCPYKHRNTRVEDACRDDAHFCLEILDQDAEPPVYVLKRSHQYFTQVQVQLAVTGLHKADFVVYTLKETAIVPVTFDPSLWEDTVSKLETFYRDAVLPHIDPMMQRVQAAEL
ncbi:uncharacterized protein LOC114474256 isoform X2 [Gouania willdenowi]|uniref:Uncharacterized LOC114474256 n=1 Tax=Gouania willdenowi TaxID=441366 RepID=A0A8C5G5Y6_GOUWI|nr:uncharacterized protein LOC114474256 isoform X2 [Gouania willdenowi]